MSRGTLWLSLGGLLAVTVGLSVALLRATSGLLPGALEWAWGSVTYAVAEPRVVVLLGAVPVLVALLIRSLADLPWQQRVLSLGLRLAFLGVLGLALARPERTADTRKVCTVVLVDVSDSVSGAALEEARDVARGVLVARKGEDLVKVVTFARRARLVEIEGVDLPPADRLRHGPPGAGAKDAKEPAGQEQGAHTDLESALQLSFGLFPSGYLKRVLVVSDGVETAGNALSEVERARTFGVKIFVRPLRHPPPKEVAVRQLKTPGKVRVGEPFEIGAEIYASRPTKARVRLFQGEVLNGLGGVKELDLAPGINDVKFSSVVRLGGKVTYSLEVDRVAEDTFPANNRVSASVDVPGRPQVLYVEGQPQRGTYLQAALGAQEFDVDLRAATAFPASLEEMERYDFFVLSDVPRERVSPSQEMLVERYVRDLGGGFLMAGGTSGFGLGGWAHSAIERILPVRMDAEQRKDMPSVAMAIVIDRSGSMTGLPLEMAKAACRATVETLEGDDLIEVVAFDSTPVRYVRMQPARYRVRIEGDIARIQPGGGTEVFAALDMAYQDMTVTQARRKHVILLTDGRAETQGIRDLVQAMVAESITVTTVGLGDSADGDLLRTIADSGGGRYHHVPDPNALPRIFTREAELVSRQAAVEEWFPVSQSSAADFLSGINVQAAPLLHGYVATQMKQSPAQEVLSSERGEPILARLRVGLGWTLAWTSDVKNQWATDWLRWSGFSRFWGQLVREHMRRKHRRELPMQAELVDGRVRVAVDAFTAEERFDNGMTSRLVVTGPGTKSERRDVPLRQVAPGRYEADFPLNEHGAFLLEAEHSRPDPGTLEPRPVGVSYAEVSNPYPREYARLEPDVERLARLATTTGGAVDPAAPALFDPGVEKIVHREALWSKVLWSALALFLLDLLVRRVRLFDRHPRLPLTPARRHT